jgi:hypothetical protein
MMIGRSMTMTDTTPTTDDVAEDVDLSEFEDDAPLLDSPYDDADGDEPQDEDEVTA